MESDLTFVTAFNEA